MLYSKIFRTDSESFLVVIPDDVEDVDRFLDSVIAKPVLGWSAAVDTAEEAERAALDESICSIGKAAGPITHGCKAGKCPICGADVAYGGDQEIVDDAARVSWACEKCGASGYEWSNLVFSEMQVTSGEIVFHSDPTAPNAPT